MINLNIDERQELINRLKKERDSRVNDRIKIVLWSDEGKSAVEIAKLLFIDDSTVYRHLNDYESENRLKPNYKGTKPLLTEEESNTLSEHVVKS